ncbi:(4Fe-4S)-binding protein [Candidatus Bathyarchaeota archaeon]|nr:MAG: (4Fe-4S)-binding protein [Candidatus Bathyarchaeota archaeon]
MKVSRRDFTRRMSVSFLSGLIPLTATHTRNYTYSMLVDLDKCIGCNRCTVACKEWNHLPTGKFELYRVYMEKELTPTTWTVVKARRVKSGRGERIVFFKWQCMHCLEPTCVSVCPAGALWKRGDGPVLYDVDRCIGCRYCVTACPFGIPHFDEEAKAIRKCTMCFDRLDRGLKPACVSSCPTGALDFDLRSRIVRRVLADGRHVYGLQEAGGTSVIYVSSIPFEELGFPRLSPETPARFSSNLLAKFFMIGLAGLVIASALYGAYRLFLRRVEAKSRSASTKPLERRMTIL